MKRRPAKEIVNAFLDYENNNLKLVERTDDGVVYHEVPAESSFFLKKADVPPDIDRMLRNSSKVTAFIEEGDYYRVKLIDRKTCKETLKGFAHRGIKTYDGDLSSIRRFLIDSKLRPSKPRSCFLDIEADSKVSFSKKEQARIFCWVVINAETGEEFRGLLKEDTDEDERWLLVRLWNVLNGFDQVLAWNGDRYDFPVIQARSKLQGIKIEFRRWLWLDFLELFRRMNVMAAESGEEKQSYALQAIATAVLGYGKLGLDSSKSREAYDNTNVCSDNSCMKCRNCLVEYCAQDVRLMPQLEKKKGYIGIFHSLCEVCRCFPDSYAINPSVQVEGYIMDIARDRGHKFPTRLDRSNIHAKFKGAFVLHPTRPGMTKNVHVADFKSLYPSIIITWNISPETKTVRPDEHSCVAPGTNCYFDTRIEGILPFAVAELIRLRKKYQDLMASLPPNTPEWFEAYARATAFKIACNSFYGVAGSPASRIFDRDVAESVTQAGVWLIQNVIREAATRDMPALFGDTDSVAVIGPTVEKFSNFVFKFCNEDLIPRLVDACGCKVNRIKLDYDKAFERIFIPVDKDGETVAKKYAGALLLAKGKEASADSEPEIKGLEFKRGDSSRLARQLQKEVIDKLCKERCEVAEEIAIIVSKYKDTVFNKELALEDIAIAKSLSKDINEYVQKTKLDGNKAASPPHVEVARVLMERGLDIGNKISYVVIDGSSSPKKVIPAIDYTGEFDRHELWQVVYKPTRRLVAAVFPDYDWEVFDKTRPKKRRGVNPNQLDLIEWIDKKITSQHNTVDEKIS